MPRANRWGRQNESGIAGTPTHPGPCCPAFSADPTGWSTNRPYCTNSSVPPLQSERMFAQKATFTVHGDDHRGLEVQCPDVIRRVDLPLEALEAAHEFLDYADLTQYAIYPDIVGMARYIRRKAFGDDFG